MGTVLARDTRRRRRRQPRRAERECDCYRAEANHKRAGVEPVIAAKHIENPAAHQWADGHTDGRSQCRRTESRTHDARSEILADQDWIEMHDAAIGHAEEDGQRIEAGDVSGDRV